MATTRSYGDACGIARALDVIGARWALLVVRELLFGPLRFSDLRRALPGASTNMLTDRLRELEGGGVITRRRLPPPAGAAVYELTDWGRELEPVLLDLGAWGLRVPPADAAVLSPTSAMLFLRGAASFDPDAPDMVVRLTLDERVFTATVTDGRVHVEARDPETPHASLGCSPDMLNQLLGGELDLDTALADGLATADGDRSRLHHLVGAVALSR